MNLNSLDFKKKNTKSNLLYDKWLLASIVCILLIGLLMVASSSIVISEKQYHEPFHYLIRQTIYLFAGLICAMIVIRIEIKNWNNISGRLLLLSFVLLILVLIPGIGRSVNGSMRWIGTGFLGIQVSELVKLCIVIYLASYLVRHQQEVQTKARGFLKPILILIFICVLLLQEPDFGAAVVILITSLSLIFLAGVSLVQFSAFVGVSFISVVMLAISSPYRLERLTTFLNPWANQFDSGYQLTQSLIAFGQGGLFGVGLGESVQKLFYLPEAHTDFLFAVLAEELGLVGVIIVLFLYSVFIIRSFLIARRAHLHGDFFAAYMAYGISIWLALQTIINIGVNAGILPTKGLTLPLMSYGGSSMLISCIAIALLFRIDYEVKWAR